MSELKCPYCNSTFKDKAEISMYADKVRVGSGLLEGDTSKW